MFAPFGIGGAFDVERLVERQARADACGGGSRGRRGCRRGRSARRSARPRACGLVMTPTSLLSLRMNPSPAARLTERVVEAAGELGGGGTRSRCRARDVASSVDAWR